MSFVFFEQAKNAWYNNNRQDFHLRFEDPSKRVEGHGDKMEEIVSDIVKCEVVYVREVLGKLFRTRGHLCIGMASAGRY